MAEEPQNPATLDQEADDLDLPAGDHPLEVAARRGFGPLSQLSTEVWHGQARPCVSCGQLVERGAAACDFCSQDLREEMLEKMRQHAGPWYVLEHLRPFPGVSLERIVRQIRRGLITETSIVRGPATDYQWRFAVETPSLCRYFGRCWNCHHEVSATDTYCPSCLTHLSFQRFPEPREPDVARSATAGQPGGPSSGSVGSPAYRNQSTAELTKPLEVRPEYLPAGPTVPAASATAGPAMTASSAYAAHLRHQSPQVAPAPFEPRTAAPTASPLGIPDSTPTFVALPRAAFGPTRQVGAPPALAGSAREGVSPIPTRPGAPAFQSRDSEVSPRLGPAVAGRGMVVAKPSTPELARLATAVASFDVTAGDIEPATPTLPRAAWIAGAVVVIAIVTLIALAT